MQKCVIFDIDGVLAKKSPKRDYREYDKVDLDEPIETGFNLCESYLLKDYNIIFITGRKELCRHKTIQFIFNNLNKANQKFITDIKNRVKNGTLMLCNTSGSKIDLEDVADNELYEYLQNQLNNSLLMRADNDHRPAFVLKKELYETHIKGKYQVELAIDDDPKICEMWKQEGISTLEVKR